MVDNSGIFYTPSWPRTYQDNMPYSCTWHIKVSDLEVVKLTVMDLDTGSFDYYGDCWIRSSSRKTVDALSIKGMRPRE